MADVAFGALLDSAEDEQLPAVVEPLTEATVLTKSQHGLAALMTAAAIPPLQIRKQLGISKAKYKLFLQSGVFNALVASYRKRLLEHGLNDAAVHLLGDAKRNVEFLQEIRDGNFADDPKRMRVRLSASQTLFEKQFPKGEATFDQSRVDNALRSIANATCAEVGEAIEITAVPLDQAIAELENK